MFTNDSGTIIIDNKKYYYKRNDAYVEILMEKIADLYNLNHAHYEVITSNGKNYYISEDLNNKGRFVTAEHYLLDTNYLYKIIDIINKKYHNRKIIRDIFKMYFMDLLVLNIDRSNGNWGFLTKDNKTDLYILDNDLSFIYNNSVITSIENNSKNNSLLEIENIYKTFDTELIELFEYMYKLLDTKRLEYFIKETEHDINMTLPNKDNYLNRFDYQRYKIEQIRTLTKK